MPVSRESLGAEFRVLDAALASTSGVTLKFESRGQRTHVRQRLYRARSLDRAGSKEVYPPESENWGRSPYDDLAFESRDPLVTKWSDTKVKEPEEWEGTWNLVIMPAENANQHLDCVIEDNETGQELTLGDSED